MLVKRIIPCLDIYEGRVVRDFNFIDQKNSLDPIETAKMYDEDGADELIFRDITASAESRLMLMNIVAQIAKQTFIPFTVESRIESCEDFNVLLKNGADKVAINAEAINNPFLISEAALRFGSQCVVVAIDAKKTADGIFKVFLNGGQTETELNALEWAMKAYEFGAGEIILTNLDFVGTKRGYDNELISLVSNNIGIPVIASGGAGSRQHFYDAFVKGKADAVQASSIFHHNEIKISDLKLYLKEKNISVRI